MNAREADATGRIALVGLACRVPGAADAATLWRRLRAGEECLSVFSRAELVAAGVAPARIDRGDFVPVQGWLPDGDAFDAQFFGLSAWEAQLTDPQQRLFLECCWEALEDAGLAGRAAATVTGVYGGAGFNTYLHDHLGHELDPGRPGAAYQAVIANDKDFLASRVAHRLDLRGPAVTVQTACSTSLVAVHLACQALLDGECDLALAGGVALRDLDPAGYIFEAGMILSPDGHCRAFDADAAGTVGASGVGVVVLKRLADAVRDGDPLRAVILGSAINNDGGAKVGFTAPNVAGQAAVIAEALAVAGVEPGSVSYVEAHGTGTPLGDPIEVAALNRAFGPMPAGQCALGSLKTNLGHLDAAAGVAGLIKTVLALEHRELPPSLHFRRPNPRIDFAAGPFVVNAELRPWPGPEPRRAGVSSFGLGGTNAHVVLEEAPRSQTPRPADADQLVVLSAKTPRALAAARERLAGFLCELEPAALPDVAYTLQTGRAELRHRWAAIGRDPATLAALGRGESAAGWSATGEAAADIATRLEPPLETLMESQTETPLEILARRWLAGARVDWEALAEPGRRRLPSVPTYPFERHRHRPAPAAAPREALGDWFYVPSWRLGAPARSARVGPRRWLLQGDPDGLGTDLAALLEARGDDVLRMPRGASGAISGLAAAGWRPDVVVHSAAAAPQAKGSLLGEVIEALRAAADAGWLDSLRLVLVSGGLAAVDGDDALDPARAPLLAALRVVPQEHPGVQVRALDLGTGTDATMLLAELDADEPANRLVALRGRRRWLESWERWPLPAAAPGAGIRPGRLYLVTGGLGRVGLALAQELAAAGAKLLVTGRRTAAAATPEVLYRPADAADEDAMARALDEAEARFGPLAGVVHAAGETDLAAFAPGVATDAGLLRRHAHPKLGGVAVLAHLLAGRRPDFVVLCSSLSSALGGVGYLAYSAANLALDAAAENLARTTGQRWLAVGWDGWRAEGVEASGDRDAATLTRAEGAEVFRRLLGALAHGEVPARVLISTRDLVGRAGQPGASTPAIPTPGSAVGGARPPHAPPYEPPASATEQTLAGIWSALLGVSEVGREDEFLALGGDSLLATQVVSRLRASLAVELPLARLLGGVPLARLAHEIDGLRGAPRARRDEPCRVEVEL